MRLLLKAMEVLPDTKYQGSHQMERYILNKIDNQGLIFPNQFQPLWHRYDSLPDVAPLKVLILFQSAEMTNLAWQTFSISVF